MITGGAVGLISMTTRPRSICKTRPSPTPRPASQSAAIKRQRTSPGRPPSTAAPPRFRRRNGSGAVTVDQLNVAATSGTALDVINSTGLTVTNGSVSNAGGTAVNINGSTVNLTLASASATNVAGGIGLNLTGDAGSIDIGQMSVNWRRRRHRAHGQFGGRDLQQRHGRRCSHRHHARQRHRHNPLPTAPRRSTIARQRRVHERRDRPDHFQRSQYRGRRPARGLMFPRAPAC